MYRFHRSTMSSTASSKCDQRGKDNMRARAITATMRPKGQHCLTRFLPKVLHLLEGQPDLLSRRCSSSHRLRFKSVNCQTVLPFNLARRPLRLVTCASGSGGTDASGVELSPARRSDAKKTSMYGNPCDNKRPCSSLQATRRSHEAGSLVVSSLAEANNHFPSSPARACR